MGNRADRNKPGQLLVEGEASEEEQQSDEEYV